MRFKSAPHKRRRDKKKASQRKGRTKTASQARPRQKPKQAARSSPKNKKQTEQARQQPGTKKLPVFPRSKTQDGTDTLFVDYSKDPVRAEFQLRAAMKTIDQEGGSIVSMETLRDGNLLIGWVIRFQISEEVSAELAALCNLSPPEEERDADINAP